MTWIRTRMLVTLAAVLLTGIAACDTIFGPEAPASIEISASRTTLDLIGDTVLLSARVLDSDGEVLPDAAVTWESSAPAIASVDSSGLFTALANGTARVRARTEGITDSLTFTVDSPIHCLVIGDLGVPAAESGSLSSGDCVVDGSTIDVWRLTLDDPLDVSIELASSDFDAVLLLFDATGALIGFNDDGGLGTDSRLYQTLGGGTYYVYVTSYLFGERGSYEVRVTEGQLPSPCPATAVLEVPDTVAGTVDDSSCDYAGFLIDVWRLNVERDTTLVLEVNTEELEATLVVADTLGQFLGGTAEGPGTGAWLQAGLRAGSYDLWIGDGDSTGVTGGYTLSATQGSALVQCPTEGGIAAGETVTGALTAEDCYLFFGRGEGWDLVVEDTAALEMIVTGDDLHPLITISDAEGQAIMEFGGEESVAQGVAPLDPGSYRVWVRSLSGALGVYSLTVQEEGQLPSCETTGSLAVGDTVSGALATTDCSLPQGQYADVWTVQVDTASVLQIGLGSDKFDPFLMVADSSGQTVARDDDSGEDGNAELTLELEPGVYQLWATSYSPDAVGAYDLYVAQGAASSVTAGVRRGSQLRPPARPPATVEPRVLDRDAAPAGWLRPVKEGPGPRWLSGGG